MPFSSLRDPVLAGSRLSEPEAVLGKPLASLAASHRGLAPRLARHAPVRSSQAFRPGVFLEGPPLFTPRTERKLEVVPARGRVEKPTVNASGSPIVAGRGKGRGNELHRPGDHPDSQPGGRLSDGRGAKGEPWALSRESVRQGRVTRSAHIGYYDNTTTASSCHGSCLSNPIGFLSLPPRAPPHPLQQSPGVQEVGPPEKGRRSLASLSGPRGKTRVEGPAGGTVGGRGSVSGREKWRSGKRKREIGWSGKTGEDFECNSWLI